MLDTWQEDTVLNSITWRALAVFRNPKSPTPTLCPGLGGRGGGQVFTYEKFYLTVSVLFFFPVLVFVQ